MRGAVVYGSKFYTTVAIGPGDMPQGPCITRFRPTPNLDLHAGHISTYYWNWYFKERAGGKLILTLDDLSYNWQRCGRDPNNLSLEEAREHYVEDLTWLGMPPDEVYMASDYAEATNEYAEKLGIKPPKVGFQGEETSALLRRVGHVLGSAIVYHPYGVLAAAVEDRLCGVSLVIRGADLASEAQLYDFLCWRCGFVAPEQQFAPLVRRGSGFVKESKSNKGTPTIRQLRQLGVMAEQVMDTIHQLDQVRKGQGRDCLHIMPPVLTLPEQLPDISGMTLRWGAKENYKKKLKDAEDADAKAEAAKAEAGTARTDAEILLHGGLK